MTSVIDAKLLKQIIQFGEYNLRANKKIVDELNVFPIPDGDTGENMLETYKGGCNAIKNATDNHVGKMLQTCADNMVLNAKGNSGVILSQLVFGIAASLAQEQTLTPLKLAQALQGGVKCGYTAVDNPVEGTMLTVARQTCEHMLQFTTDGTTFEDFASEALRAIKTSVDNTPQYLKVLQDAGVVDSGGAGIYYIFEGYCKFFANEQLPQGDAVAATVAAEEVDFEKFTQNSVLEFGYCSEVLVRLQSCKVNVDNFDVQPVKDFLATIGDSVVTVLNGSVLKIHVHTFTPHKLLEYCQTFGEFLKIKIDNMTLQHQNVTIQNQFETKKPTNAPRKKYGVVAVASGQGIIDMFDEFGADFVINGGQTNNPSVENFVEAFDSVNAEVIFVLPNNGNIILSAKQAAKIYNKAQIVVLETKNVGEGYSAISMLDLDCPNVEDIVEGVNQEISNTLTALFSVGIRDSVCNGIQVEKDKYVGIVGKQILSCSADRVEAVMQLLAKIPTSNFGCCMLIYGKNVAQSEVNDVTAQINKTYGGLEVYEIDGKQEIYDIYLILN